MSRFIRSTGCKINLGLRVLRLRADGFHDLETVMYPIGGAGFRDLMEFVPEANSTRLTLTSSGVAVDCPTDRHLCYKAWSLLRDVYGIAGGAFHIHKTIPTGAGLGGGSANAAGALELFNEAFELNLSLEKLVELGASLGSDVPFFARRCAQFAEGRGDILRPIGLDLGGKFLVVLKPILGISTAEAYAGLTPHEGGGRVSEIVSGCLEQWRGRLENDFEPSIFARHPILGELKAALYERGAIYAAMSGSGSSIYGIFEGGVECRDLPYYIYSEPL